MYKLPAYVVNNIRDRLVELAAEAQKKRELQQQQEQHALVVQNTHESLADASVDGIVDMEPDEYARPMTASSSHAPLPLSSQRGGLSQVGSESELPLVPPARLNKWAEKPAVSHIPSTSGLTSPTLVVNQSESALTDLPPPSRPTTAPHIKGKYAQVTSYELFGRKIVPGEQDPELNKFTLELVQEGANTLRAGEMQGDHKLPLKGLVSGGIRGAPTASAAKRPSSAQAPMTHSNNIPNKKPSPTAITAKNANNKAGNKASPTTAAAKVAPAVIAKADDSWIRPPPSDGDGEEDEDGQNYDQDDFEVSDNMRLNRSQLVEDHENQDDICIDGSSSDGGDDNNEDKVRVRSAFETVEKRENISSSEHDVNYSPSSATIYDDEVFEADVDADDGNNEEGKIAELQELERSAANLESWLETLVSASLLHWYTRNKDIRLYMYLFNTFLLCTIDPAGGSSRHLAHESLSHAPCCGGGV